MAPRMSYLPLLTEQVREHFSSHARHPHIRTVGISLLPHKISPFLHIAVVSSKRSHSAAASACPVWSYRTPPALGRLLAEGARDRLEGAVVRRKRRATQMAHADRCASVGRAVLLSANSTAAASHAQALAVATAREPPHRWHRWHRWACRCTEFAQLSSARHSARSHPLAAAL